MKKKILMLGTGGTIASKQTEHGLTPGLSSEEVLSYIPQASNYCSIETLQVCSIDSTNITPEHWKLVVVAIENNYEKYDGFVICHGTDTMAYTASALSYMIQYSKKPIVITGAQKPIDMEVTDAKTNLLDSFIYASDDESQGVDIVFDGKVIIGTRAKKVNAKSFNAFSSINFPYPAVIQDQKIIRYIPSIPYKEDVRFYHNMNDSIFVLKLIPGIKSDMLSYIFNNYDCLVIESFGVGGIPESIIHTFYNYMKEWTKKGKIAVMTTQVANEGSDMTVYQVGKTVKADFDMVEAYDMTLESTITKLMWILSLDNVNYEEMKGLFYKQINHDILFKENRS
ncbi:asparaginase [Lachnospiraceae bacterium LCP25S3_G4]